MAEKFYTIVTQIGLAKIANAQLTTDKLELSTIVVGDGSGSYYNPESNATTLKKEVWRGGVGSIGVDENNPNWIVVESVIPATIGGFTVREVGLLDSTGDLIAIGKYPATYKPVLADGSSKDLYIRVIIEVASASVVTLKVDPTIVIASRKYVDDKIAGSQGAIDQAVSGVTDGTITILPLETTDKTLAGAINEINAKADGNKENFTTHLADGAAHAIGDKATLQTTEKGTIVGAVNELFTNVSDGKSLVGGAITDVDSAVVLPPSPTFTDLATGIGQISTGKKWASGEIMSYTENVGSNMQIIYVTGLDFKPKIVWCWSKQYVGFQGFINDYTNVDFKSGNSIGAVFNVRRINTSNAPYLYADGFKVFGGQDSRNSIYEWIAFE